MPLDAPLACQRHLFDLPNDLLYFNAAAQTPCPTAAASAGREAVRRKWHPWDPERQKLGGEISRARELFAGLIGAEARDVAVTLSTSYGVAVAARNLSVGAGKSILVLQDQFPSNWYAWAEVAKRDGGSIRTVARPADGDWTAAVLEQLDSSVGLVALPNVHWCDGAVLDLVAISARVKQLGVPFVIDATQSVGAMATDIAAIDPDFMIVSGYKWLLCPDSIGFTYVAPRQQGGTPIEFNYAAYAGDPPMEMAVGYGDTFADGAKRFDMGAADSMIHLPMTVAALEQLHAWTVDGIAGYLRPIVDRIAGLAEERGFSAPPPAFRSPHFIGIRRAAPIPSDLPKRLSARGAHVSLRGGAIRIAPYLYNEIGQVDRLFEAIDAELA